MAAQKVTRAAWGEVAPRLARAMGSDAEVLRAEYDAGALTAWACDDAAMLTRVEGDELVVVAMEGRGLDTLLPYLTAKARAAGLKTMRAHTQRTGLLRLAQRIDPAIYQREIVIAKDL